jgi:steroid Delta-isomerase
MRTPLELAQASLDATKAHDRDTWLVLWEDDGTIEDPVGTSDLDPSGLGHRGIKAITTFWDDVISKTGNFAYEIERSYTCGDEVAVAVNFQIASANTSRDMDVINIYRRSANGKLTSLRSFWDGTRQGR